MLPLLDPKNDYIFKRLFAQSPELLSDLINSIRYDQPPITITDILNPNISGEDLHAKEIVLDVLAKDGHGFCAHQTATKRQQSTQFLL